MKIASLNFLSVILFHKMAVKKKYSKKVYTVS